MVFQETILKKIVTTNIKKPTIANVTVDNPLDKAVFVNGIELILQPEFARKGKIRILINEVAVFTEADSKAFKGYSKFPIPLGKVLRQSSDIQIFAWNSEDSNQIELAVNLSVSEALLPFNSQAEVLGQQVSNLVVSQSDIIFPQASRAVGTFIKLIDMQGYKKLIVTLSKTTPTLFPNVPTLDGSWESIDPTNLQNMIDGNLSSKTNFWRIDQDTGIINMDTGSIATRALKIKHRIKTGLQGLCTLNVETSDDDIVYNLKVTSDFANSTDRTETLDATKHSFRYVRLTYIGGGDPSAAVQGENFENYDSDILGGTGALSFEVRNPESGTFTEFISASEFGTITDGVSDIVKQVGDVTTISVSGKTYALPSTQTDFRVKYIITVGALTNSVVLLKVL